MDYNLPRSLCIPEPKTDEHTGRLARVSSLRPGFRESTSGKTGMFSATSVLSVVSRSTPVPPYPRRPVSPCAHESPGLTLEPEGFSAQADNPCCFFRTLLFEILVGPPAPYSASAQPNWVELPGRPRIYMRIDPLGRSDRSRPADPDL